MDDEDLRERTNSHDQAGSEPAHKVQQPKPQALAARTGPSSILVSPRQKGNPILNNIRALPWEYSDIPADYVLGLTTCALFLSLKYHRLHPEYIYSRIKALAGKYNLRILLTMVDIQNHEESLKELSKTSLINNVTIVLCWSAQEAARYLELFKSYEHAAPTSIKAHQSTTYSQKLVDFITVPRSINKTDAVGLVSSFGSLRTAVNARPEEVALVAGWGEKKVQRWCSTVREDFRVQRAAKRGIAREESHLLPSRPDQVVSNETPKTRNVDHLLATDASSNAQSVRATPGGTRTPIAEDMRSDEDEEQVLREPDAFEAMEHNTRQSPPHSGDTSLSEGISAALERLRRQA